MNRGPGGSGRVWALVATAEPADLSLTLPVVDTLMPDVARAGISEVRLGYLSTDPTADQRARLAALLGPCAGALPQNGQAGAFLALDAQVADLRHTFQVPLGSAKRQPAPPGPGGVNTSAVAWWSAGREVGPVRLERLGVGYADNRVLLVVDASVSAGGLELAVKGAGVDVALKEPPAPVFHLDGLGLGLKRPPVTVAAEFVRQDVPGYTLAVGGIAVVGLPTLSVTALGFYAQPEKSAQPSLFLFGVLDLGKKSVGPPVFRLQALAAGFGYHSVVRTPRISEVGSFPFLQMLDAQPPTDPLKVLGDLLHGDSGKPAWVSPSEGGVWLAAGFRALVYELVDVSAVAIAEFGDDFVVGLYGRAQARFPKEGTSPWATLAVDVRAEYRRSTDTLELDAAVADGSFVLDRNCRLHGGLAARLWFAGSAHPGDFVVTVGGYHPRFDRPGHYPAVERLGFDWNISSSVYARGGCYAALTPHAFMAGLNASLHGEWGPAKADATVYADALIQWDPLYFDVDWGGTIRGSIWGVGGELSADGRVWGPPVGGSAGFKVLVTSVPIEFGADRVSGADQLLSATEFRRRLLPGGGDGSAGDGKVVHLAPLEGLLPALADADANAPAAVWSTGRGTFRFAVDTAVPATAVTVNTTDPGGGLTDKLHIRPVEGTGSAAPGYTSHLAVTLTRRGENGQDVQVPVNDQNTDESWTAATTRVGVPGALWSTAPQDLDSPKPVDGYATGVTVTSPAQEQSAKTLFPDKAWQTKPFTLAVTNEPAPGRFDPAAGTVEFAMITQDITAAATVARRTAVAADLAARGIPGLALPAESDLSTFAGHGADYLDAVPRLVEGTS
ncbi:DUF6603 domain-containing protein [Kitasatospora sp. NPDC008115]|uniref:DUF6603 domain-containing protein n=1 Tax=Kitasatospora sp. NPDC008115 TaxID=3364022 RepID=UPI0036E186DA